MNHLIATDDPLVGKLYHVPLNRDFEQIIISAERYACGRRTYIVKATVDYILELLPQLSYWCIKVMQNDLKSEFDTAERLKNTKMLGDSCDVEQWKRFREALEAELKERGKT